MWSSFVGERYIFEFAVVYGGFLLFWWRYTLLKCDNLDLRFFSRMTSGNCKAMQPILFPPKLQIPERCCLVYCLEVVILGWSSFNEKHTFNIMGCLQANWILQSIFRDSHVYQISISLIQPSKMRQKYILLEFGTLCCFLNKSYISWVFYFHLRFTSVTFVTNMIITSHKIHTIFNTPHCFTSFD